MTFAELLAAVATRLKLPARPPPDARNMEITLASGTVLNLSLLADDATVSIAAMLWFYPEAAKLPAMFETLLAANAYGYATRGACFAVDQPSSKVFLFRTFALDGLDLDAFMAALRDFLDVHRSWSEAYENGKFWALAEAEAA
jgi:hypothetical protein